MSGRERKGRIGRPTMGDVDAIYMGYIAAIPGVAGSLSTVLFVGAELWAIFNGLRRAYPIRLPRSALPFAVTCVFCFLVFLVTGLLADRPFSSLLLLGPLTIVLFSPLIIARLRHSTPELCQRLFIRYSPLGVVVGSIAFWASGSIGGGAGNPGMFGLAIAVMGIASLAGVYSQRTAVRAVAIAGFGLAFAMEIASESRSIIVMMAIVPFIALMCTHRSNWKTVGLVVVALGVVAAALSPIIIPQMAKAVAEIAAFGPNAEFTSMGARLAMWETAFRAIGESPLLGYGIQNRMDVVLNDPSIAIPGMSFTHLHNQFIDAFVAGGIFAFVGVVLLFATPLLMLFPMRENPPERSFLILSVVTVFAGSALFGPVFTNDLATTLYLLPIITAAATHTGRDDLTILGVAENASRHPDLTSGAGDSHHSAGETDLAATLTGDSSFERQAETGSVKLDFIVGGIQKAGTTSLFGYLAQHPDLHTPTVKELHYFDDETLDWSEPDGQQLARAFPDASGARLKFDVTPIYLFWPPSIERILAHNPQMRLIFIFRDPIERAWSHWRMERARNAENLPFSVAVRQGRWRLRDKPRLHHDWRVYSYVERGFYADQVRRLREVVEADRVLFLRSDDLAAAHMKVLNKVAEFLEIPPFPELPARLDHVGTAGSIDDVDIRYLRDIFRDDVLEFSRLTGLRVDDWLTMSTDGFELEEHQ